MKSHRDVHRVCSSPVRRDAVENFWQKVATFSYFQKSSWQLPTGRGKEGVNDRANETRQRERNSRMLSKHCIPSRVASRRDVRRKMKNENSLTRSRPRVTCVRRDQVTTLIRMKYIIHYRLHTYRDTCAKCSVRLPCTESTSNIALRKSVVRKRKAHSRLFRIQCFVTLGKLSNTHPCTGQRLVSISDDLPAVSRALSGVCSFRSSCDRVRTRCTDNARCRLSSKAASI